MLTVGAVLPSLTVKLHLNGLQAGSLVTILPLGILAGSLVFGPVVDRFGHKIILLTSCIVVLLGLEGIAFFGDIPLLQLSVFGIGFGGGMLNGETNALVSDISTDKEKGAKLSLLGAFYGIGALGIPVLLSSLSENYPFEVILQGTGAILVLCVLFCAPVRFPAPKQPQGFPFKEGLKLLKEKSLLLLGFVLFFQSGLEGVTNNWTTTYMEQATPITADNALLALTCMVAALTATRFMLAVLLRRINENVVLAGSLFIAAIGYALLAFSPGFPRGAAGMVLIGMGLASTFPVVLGRLGRLYPALSGTAFSVALVIALIGNTLLNSLTGLLSKAYSISVYPYMMIISILIMFVLLKVSPGNAVRQESSRHTSE